MTSAAESLLAVRQRLAAFSLYQALLWAQLPLFLMLLYGGWSLLQPWLDRPLTRVLIGGELVETVPQQLEKEVWESGGKDFLALDLRLIKAQLESNPWIDQVDVRRQWPTGLQVHIREQRPVARWSRGGLLNEQGEIFWPEGKPAYAHLPALEGPVDRPLALMAQYRSLSQLVRPLNLKLTALELEPRGAWTITLDNGIRLLVGRGQVIEKINRFKRVYGNQLMPYADRIKQIDLRYTNGLTVTWSRPLKNDDNA